MGGNEAFVSTWRPLPSCCVALPQPRERFGIFPDLAARFLPGMEDDKEQCLGCSQWKRALRNHHGRNEACAHRHAQRQQEVEAEASKRHRPASRPRQLQQHVPPPPPPPGGPPPPPGGPPPQGLLREPPGDATADGSPPPPPEPMECEALEEQQQWHEPRQQQQQDMQPPAASHAGLAVHLTPSAVASGVLRSGAWRAAEGSGSSGSEGGSSGSDSEDEVVQQELLGGRAAFSTTELQLARAMLRLPKKEANRLLRTVADPNFDPASIGFTTYDELEARVAGTTGRVRARARRARVLAPVCGSRSCMRCMGAGAAEGRQVGRRACMRCVGAGAGEGGRRAPAHAPAHACSHAQERAFLTLPSALTAVL